MPDYSRLTPASPDDLAEAFAFALGHEGRRRVHDAGELMAAIVAGEFVDVLDRAGFVIRQRPPIGGGAALGRGFEAAS
jgi:hypothetical protein